MNEIQEIWKELQNSEEPSFFRNVITVDYEEFSNSLETSQTLRSEVIHNLYGGDIYVVKNAISDLEVNYLKNFVHSTGKLEPNCFKTEPGCQNYHQKVYNIVDPEIGYSTINHSHYFFEWNKESEDVFEILEKPWWIGKFLSGKEHKPENSINRVHFLHYPIDFGFISTHKDFPIEQMVNTYVSLTSPGTDYDEGGFFVFDSQKNKFHLDFRIPKGSLVCWYPTVVHGADAPISSNKEQSSELDWGSIDGRWIVIMNTIQPHSNQNRKTTKSVIL